MVMSMDNSRKEELLVLKNKKVVQHNDLISSVAKMDKIPLKIFELSVAMIDVEHPPENNTVYLSKKSLFAFFKVDDTNKNYRFKESIERMQKQAYFVIKKENKNKGYFYENIVPIPYVRWNDYDDKVTIEFNHHIMPYLIDLKSNFTQYAIKDVMNLNCKYSVILYKWLCMNFNQFEHYEHKLNRTRLQLESYKNPRISILELRQLTNTEQSYLDFRNFEKRVLKQSIKEISEETHFNVTYQKIKNGRSIGEIQFFIEKKAVAPNSFYKDEQQDQVYLESKEIKAQERTLDFIKAQQSVYTNLLNIHGLIEFKDALDMEFMLQLAKSVYPLYQELESLKGISEVERHLAYVKEKMYDYTEKKKNTSKYLRLCINDYLQTIRFQNNLN